MHLRTIQLEVKRSVINEFKRLSKEVFPREAFAYLLGRDAGTIVEIEDLFIPLNLLDFSTNLSITIDEGWLPAAKRQAAELGLSVVGDIHSHAWTQHELAMMSPHRPDVQPSVKDLETFHQISGICNVLQMSNGKFRSKIKFWGPMFQVAEKII